MFWTTHIRYTDLPSRIALILIVILLLGSAYILIHDLAITPPEVPSDATHNLAEGLRISRGIPFPADFGLAPEPTFRFLVGGVFWLLGPFVFTARLLPTCLALLMVALTYQAGLMALQGRPWQRLGAMVAAAAVISAMPFLILARDLYRAILLPPLITATFIALLLCARKKQSWRWALAGFLAGCGMNAHLAGVMTPPWAIGFAIHQFVTSSREKRLGWRKIVAFLAGMAPPVLLWLAFYLLIPGWWLRVDQVGMTSPISVAALAGIWGSVQAYLSVGYLLPTFNTPHTPFLNPMFGFFALLGLVSAIWHWRRAEGALLLGGIFLFTLPGALTPQPTYPIRLIGTTSLLALLAGWGTVSLIALATRLRGLLTYRIASPNRMVSAQFVGLLVALLGISMIRTHVVYHEMFHDPANYAEPRNWVSIPHNFSMAFQESIQWLAKVDMPTYVPMWMLDNAAAMFFLQREAFPNVTTWARFGLRELPEGQFFFPVYWYYHMQAEDHSTARVLLLPREKTIVLLPGSGLPTSIAGPPPQHGDPGTSEIVNARGWTIVRTRPVPRASFVPRWPPHLADGETAPEISPGLRLLTREPVGPIQPGKSVTVLLEWLVTAPQPADLFSVVQFVNQDFVPLPGGSDHHMLFYLYPSARWQPGDIIPDWHVVSLPDPIPDGIYRWGAGAYVPPARQRLPVLPPPGVDTGPQLSDLWLWDTIRVPAPTLNAALPGTAMPINARIGHQIALEGYQLVKDAQVWTVTLYWRAIEHPSADLIIFVHAQHGDTLIAQRDEKPLGGRLPTWAWLPGELVTTTFTLELPSGKPEPNTLYVGMYSYPSLARLPVVQNGAAQRDDRVLLWSN